jgi:hypothetical protein
MNRFVAIALLIVPVSAGANTTCRQDHVHNPSSVVSTLRGAECQSALKIDPPSASKIDPPQRLVFV